MQLKTKISLLLFSSLFLVFTVIFINTLSDLRNASAQSAESQALATAKVIEAGLTAHMVAGTMDQREAFTTQIEGMENVKKLWLVRSLKVTNQYGKGLLGNDPRDGIDRKVLEEGEVITQSTGGIFEDATVRLSYPYKAIEKGKLDCLSCHDAKPGDTLGVISLEMTTNDLKTLSFRNIIVSGILLLLLFAGMVYFIRKQIIIYFDRFEAIGKCARDVEQGDFTSRVSSEYAQDKDARALNRLLDKFEWALDSIKSNFNGIIQMGHTADPLQELRDGSERLSHITHLAKTLQLDADTKEVYEHVSHHFCEQFGVDDFNIIEYNPLSQATRVAYEKKAILCDAMSGCRAARTGEVVDSSLMEGICPKMITPNEHYFCVPYSISSTTTLVMSAISDKKNQLLPIRSAKHLMDETMEGIRSEISQQILSESIASLQRIDPLSGLYNRQYLHEQLFQINRESKRTAIPYGVLVINVDRFSAVNDVYGTKVADEAIRIIGRTLLDSLRESDLIVRETGDQFVVILYDCIPEYVHHVGEKVREIFAKKKLKAHPSGFIKTVSVGASVFPHHHKNILECVEYATLAMKVSKTEGGNITTLYKEGMQLSL